MRFFFLSTLLPGLVISAASIPSLGFYNTNVAYLTKAFGTFPPGLGEPINIIISANSDSYILSSQGLEDYFVSLDHSGSCLGQSGGDAQQADLGDGHGYLNQTGLVRYNFGNLLYGTCQETLVGGSHVRYWQQNGPTANSGAWFLAASVELSLAEGHDIVKPDGYGLGRDLFVANATMGTKSQSTNQTYTTTSSLQTYLPVNSSIGVNHGLVIDGMVAILTVKLGKNATAAAVPVNSSAMARTGSSSSKVRFEALYGLLALLASLH